MFTPTGGSFKNAVMVDTNSDTEFSPSLKAIYIGGPGSIIFDAANGTKITQTSASGWFYVEMKKIYAASTSTDVTGYW